MKKYDTKFTLPHGLSNNKLREIIWFYLFECPVEEVSHRGKTFEEYGFKGAPSFNSLKKALLKSATKSLSKSYFPSKEKELKTNLKKCESINYPDEYCVFLIHGRKVIRSLFSAIRNALAHGSFNVKSYEKTRIYFFSNYDGYEKARIVLYEDTLLAWIKIIQKGI